MNKQVIKKYKAEFDYILNDDNTLQIKSDDNPEWVIADFKEAMFHFDIEGQAHDLLIVIVDEYLEFRKALAEGKTVLVSSKHYHTGWYKFGCKSEHRFCSEFNFIIKPDEPKYRVGQWFEVEGTVSYIVEEFGNGDFKVKFRDKEGYWILESSWSTDYNKYAIDEPEFKVGDYVVDTEGTIGQVITIRPEQTVYKGSKKTYERCNTSIRIWTLEEAEDDEWVMYWDNEDSNPEMLYRIGMRTKKGFLKVNNVNDWDNLVPYIGQTPKQLGLEK